MKIEKTYDIPYSLQRVYDAWIASSTVIAPATSMDIDPRVGGHYRLLIDSPEFAARNEGSFLRVEALSRLTYTWEWNNDGDVSTIDVRFSETAAGTRVELVHSGFSTEENMSNHDSGWDNYIKGFSEHLAGSTSDL